jgi:hypothetical protein
MRSKQVTLFECEKCKGLHPTKESADSCCVCHICKQADGYYGKIFTATCQSCQSKKTRDGFQSMLDKAEVADPADKILFPNGSMLFDDGGDFYQDEDDYLDTCECDNNQPEKELFIAKYVGFNPSFDQIISGYIEEYHTENGEVEFDGLSEFEKAFNEFVDKNKKIHYFAQNYKYKTTINIPEKEEGDEE